MGRSKQDDKETWVGGLGSGLLEKARRALTTRTKKIDEEVDDTVTGKKKKKKNKNTTTYE